MLTINTHKTKKLNFEAHFPSMKKLSFARKLILIVLLACTGAIAVVGSYSFYNARRSLMARTFEQLTSVRTIRQRQVEQFFSDRLREMKMIASRQPVLDLAANYYRLEKNSGLFNLEYLPQKPDYSLHIEDYLDEGGYCKQLFLLLPDCSQLQLYTNKNEKLSELPLAECSQLFDHLSKCHGGMIVDLENPVLDMNHVLVVAKVDSDHNDFTLLVMEISIESISALMFDESGLQGLGSTGETFIVGSDNLMRTPSRFNTQSVFRTRVETEATKLSFEGRQGTMVINDYRGVQVLSSFSALNIPGLDWAICAEIDLKEATVPVYRIRNNIILVSTGTGLFVFLIILLVSKMLTRPIVKLMQATDEIGSGKFNTRVLPESADEIGKLTLAFNRMARQLQQNDEALKNEKAQRIRSVLDGQELERQRLSRELHDGLGQSLIALKLRLESLELKPDTKNSQIIAKIRKSFDAIIDEVRRISNNLMPAALHEFGLENALRNHCEELSAQTNTDIRFFSNGIPLELNRKAKIYLYRIAQEALNNVLKHARASQVKVSLLKAAGSVQLIVEDNGRGINQEENCKGKGNGLYNMRERVNLLQGTMRLNSTPGKGTTISIDLPLN